MKTLIFAVMMTMLAIGGCDILGSQNPADKEDTEQTGPGNEDNGGGEKPGGDENTGNEEKPGNGDNTGGNENEEPEDQPELPAGVIRISVKDFLAAEVDDTWYGLTGTIRNLKDEVYGNFDLVDETGSVYVYGLTKTKVSKNDRSFSSLGLKEGDVVTLAGQRYCHEGLDEVNGPAYYISHKSGNSSEDPGTDPDPGVGTEPGGSAAAGWLELPAKGNVSTATEYFARANGKRNYTAYYDTKTYSSLWVAYPLAKGHMGSLKRPGGWSFAPGIDENLQVDLTGGSYGTDHSRGHQIANSDRNGIREMQLQTFYVINSTPQLQDRFNGYIWNALENDIQGAVPSSDTLYIATGPVYRTVGGSESISYSYASKDKDKKVPIANYFFKVILKVKRSGSRITDAKAVGFWFEHRNYSDRMYEKYAVSVDEIETKTGFDFFANLPDDLEKTAETNTSWSSFSSF